MNRAQLLAQIIKKKSFLCVGLDSDITKIPAHLMNMEDPIFAFNKQIIDATLPYTVAYKPNIAFYESYGVKGWVSLQKTIQYLNQHEVFTIADAKRGDIGNTSTQYAKAFFDESQSGLNFDAVTVAPYMGADSVTPFLSFKDKWVILLALTSNKGSDDFQQIMSEGKPLFEHVLEKANEWGTPENMMYVVGATKAEMLAEIRKIVPNHFLLVPGVGAQGGSLQEVATYGMTPTCGLLVNSSRGIIFASNKEDFAEVAAQEAKLLQEEMATLLVKYGVI